MLNKTEFVPFILFLFLTLFATGCTVKAVGDPNRPITINANIVVDIRGLKKTAVGIEDMVAGRGNDGQTMGSSLDI